MPHSGVMLSYFLGLNPNEISRSALLKIQGSTEFGKGILLHWGWEKNILKWGNTVHTLLMGETIGVGTQHKIEGIKVGTQLACWLAGWLSH